MTKKDLIDKWTGSLIIVESFEKDNLNTTKTLIKLLKNNLKELIELKQDNKQKNITISFANWIASNYKKYLLEDEWLDENKDLHTTKELYDKYINIKL